MPLPLDFGTFVIWDDGRAQELTDPEDFRWAEAEGRELYFGHPLDCIAAEVGVL